MPWGASFSRMNPAPWVLVTWAGPKNACELDIAVYFGFSRLESFLIR